MVLFPLSLFPSNPVPWNRALIRLNLFEPIVDDSEGGLAGAFILSDAADKDPAYGTAKHMQKKTHYHLHHTSCSIVIIQFFLHITFLYPPIP
jgi:hypothetical protein